MSYNFNKLSLGYVMKGVYEIKNTENDKIYIGSSKNFDARWEKHRQKLEANRHYNQYLQNAWNKYGEDTFEFNILESGIDEENLKEKEKEYIELYGVCDDENGYNLDEDPTGGDTISNHPNYDELMEKWSEANSGEKNGFWNKTHSDETLNKLRKMSEGGNNPMYNESHDKETVRKMKERAEGRYTLGWFQEKYGEEEGKRKYEERSKRRSKYMKENNPMEKEEYREKVSEALSGREKSEETKRKISESRKGKGTGSDNGNYVHVPKEELKQKIREGLVSKELAEYFDTSQNTITSKVNKYWGEGLRSVRSKLE